MEIQLTSKPTVVDINICYAHVNILFSPAEDWDLKAKPIKINLKKALQNV